METAGHLGLASSPHAEEAGFLESRLHFHTFPRGIDEERLYLYDMVALLLACSASRCHELALAATPAMDYDRSCGADSGRGMIESLMVCD